MKGLKKLVLSIFSCAMAIACVSGAFGTVTASAAAAESAHKHTYPTEYTNDQIEVEATCTKRGYAVVECTDEECTKTKRIYIDKVAHTAPEDDVVDAPATCMKKGYNRFNCTACGKKVKVSIDKVLHQFSGDVETVAPTCTKKGYTEGKCVDCGKERKNYIAKLGHNYVINEEESKPATCALDGKTVEYCNREGCDAKKVTKLAKLGHDLVYTYEGLSCTTAGTITTSCSRYDGGVTCSKAPSTKNAKATGHTWLQGTKVADCTDGAHRNYYYCEDCGVHSHSTSSKKVICTKDCLNEVGEGHKYNAAGKCEYKGCLEKIEGYYYTVGKSAYLTYEEAVEAAGEAGKISYVMGADAVLPEQAFVVKGAKFDGNNNKLDASAVEVNPDCVITTLGGKVQDVEIYGAHRAIGTGSTGTYALVGDLTIDEVKIDGGVYAINIGNGNGYDLKVSDSILYGWNSYSGLSEAEFRKCTFGQGNTDYAYIRMYDDTEFISCNFEEGFKIGANEEGLKIVLKNCYYGSEKVTVENFAQFLTDAEDEDTAMLKNCTIVINGETLVWAE